METEDGSLEKKRRRNERLMTNRLRLATTPREYFARVGRGFKLRKKKQAFVVGNMRRGIDNCFSECSSTRQRILARSEESDKIMVKGRKKEKGGRKERAISTICIFRSDTPRTASAHHALLPFILPLPPLPRCVTARRGHTDMDCPDHDEN